MQKYTFRRESFESFLENRREPAWVSAMRREAMAMFETLPMPDRTMEEWRQTDISDFLLEQFALHSCLPSEAISLPVASLTTNETSAGYIAVLDGLLYDRKTDSSLNTAGVIFNTFNQLSDEQKQRLQPYLCRAVDFRKDKFAALQAAFWPDATVLYIPKGVKIDLPLQMFSAISSGGVDLSRTLIILDDEAEVTILSETASADRLSAGLYCGAVEIFLGQHAKLRYISLQNYNKATWCFGHQTAILAEAANLQWTVGAIGSILAKVNQHVILAGPGAETQMNGVIFTQNSQHLSYNTLQHHKAPHCRSDLLYKGALQDTSRLVWRGMVKVDPHAQKTDGYQRNDNLILSEQARADSIPGLEIEADDVKCSHGATAGRVDDEQLFYACCRGLSRTEAMRLIVTGFFQQVFDRIAIEDICNALGTTVAQHLYINN